MADTRSAGRERAVQLASEGKLEEALAEYQHLLASSPLDTEVRQRVAELLEWLGRKPEASTAYEAAAVAWARADAPLRAMAACVALSRLGALPAARVRTTRALAERFALPPGATQPAPGGVPLFSRLDAAAFTALLEALEARALFPGQTVVEEGTPGTSMFALVEGRAELSRTLEGGERKVVGTVGPGDFFGEVALISEGPRLASVVATERAVLLELSRGRLEAVAARHPQVATVVEDF
ncbi:MAG TPA: cyclic nucleotide-binding domain-containing protein, partial [Myxococcus sp.]|nr:cyclic nucleotide-binding domain-containing protein [Myxococcus sp.]